MIFGSEGPEMDHDRAAIDPPGRRRRGSGTGTGVDVTGIERWRTVAQSLAAIVEALVESPDRTFRREYWTQIAALEDKVRDMDSWTRESRLILLKRKPLLH